MIDVQDFIKEVTEQSGGMESPSTAKVLSALLTYSIQQNKEVFANLSKSLGELIDVLKFNSTADLSQTNELLKQLLAKETKDTSGFIGKKLDLLAEQNVQKIEGYDRGTHKLILAISELSENVKSALARKEPIPEPKEEKHPNVGEEGDSVTGLGKAPYRSFRSRYRKVNIKPRESVDGARTVFTLPHVPVRGTEEIKADGVSIFSDNGDYTLIGQRLTLTQAPQNSIRCNYDA